MNQLSQNGPYRNEGSRSAELMVGAERELSAFFSAAAELFGPEQATLAANDWLQHLEAMPDFPASPREWRLLSIEASARLAKRARADRSVTST
jgi:hypothetical protein